MKRYPNTYNPFGLMRSADMTDEQIDQLWVDIAIDDIGKILSQDAVIIKGGKGSGKTHLLRHYSFPLQKIRWERDKLNAIDGIKRDQYLGVYLRCSGLNASRFQGKNQSEDVWAGIFEYAFELLLAVELIYTVQLIIDDPQIDFLVSQKIMRLFDEADISQFQSLSCIGEYIEQLRKKLDLAINNCAFSSKLLETEDAKIRTTRGSLIFGIPEILVTIISEFQELSFIYFIDEYENFTEAQQCYVNTLIREKRPPVGIKVGVRKYGIKTLQTLSAGEDIREGSEYQTLPLDQKLRENEEHYRKFSYELLHNRLNQIALLPKYNDLSEWAKSLFVTYDTSWNSPDFLEISQQKNKNIINPCFITLKKKLLDPPNNINEAVVDSIINLLSFPDYPLIERVNIINFCKQLKKNLSLHDVASYIHDDCQKFLEVQKLDAESKSKTYTTWNHFQPDVIHQVCRDVGLPPYYAGIDSFIDMSEGMPRNLINILKQTYDWSLFKDESFQDKQKFSIEIQSKGVRKASDWFFNDMRMAGKDGILVQTAISRLSEIFKINHYADKPTECSLITFSANIHELSEEAQRIIGIAEDRSLLIRIDRGHKDKNFGYSRTKYQLNKMLSPRWGLPISRKGTTEFPKEDLNVIFDCKKYSEESFKDLLDKWITKTSFSIPNDSVGKEQQSLF